MTRGAYKRGAYNQNFTVPRSNQATSCYFITSRNIASRKVKNHDLESETTDQSEVCPDLCL